MPLLILQANSVPLPTRDTISKKDNIVSISSLVSEQFPEFIRIDHPRTVAFMEAYYEWMEQKDETLYSTFILKDFSDIDQTIDEFIKHFKSQYLDRFPEKLAYDHETGAAVNEKRLIKRIKDFYKAKGTEKAYQLLFRILYDTTVDFYYPKTDIIKASDGKWIDEKSIKITSLSDNDIWNSPETIVTQTNKAGEFIANAKVTNVRKYEHHKLTVAELFLTDLNGTFVPDGVVSFESGNEELIYPVLSSVMVNVNDEGISENGRGYKAGDQIYISSTNGSGARGTISSVNNNGGVSSIKLSDSGVGYRSSDSFTYNVHTLTGTGAGFTASSGAIFEHPGYFIDGSGHPSAKKHLQDNFFYQDWSYELKTDITIEKYKAAILDLIHPAGTQLFNQIFIKKLHPTNTETYTSAVAYEMSTLGHYTPYTFNTKENLRHNTQGTDLYPFGYNPSEPTVDESGNEDHTGATARDAIFWGLVYNDYAGRTAQSDSITAGNTFAYDLGIGGTWDPGTTGPMWYLSEGVFFLDGFSGASAAYSFVGTADAGDFDENGSYWVIYPHPNIRGIDSIPEGITFTSVEIQPFLQIESPINITGGIITSSVINYGTI